MMVEALCVEPGHWAEELQLRFGQGSEVTLTGQAAKAAVHPRSESLQPRSQSEMELYGIIHTIEMELLYLVLPPVKSRKKGIPIAIANR